MQHESAVGAAAQQQRQQLAARFDQHARTKSARSLERRRPDRRVRRRVGGRGAVVDHERHEQHRQLLVAVAVDVVEHSDVAAGATAEPGTPNNA